MSEKPTYEELERRVRELESADTELRKACEREAHVRKVLLAIRDVNQLIVNETDPEQLITRACASLTETRGYFNAWIAIMDEAGSSVAMTACSGFDGGFDAMKSRLLRGEYSRCMQQALVEEKVLVIKDPPSECSDCPLSSEYAGRAGLNRRLSHEGKLYGILSVSVPEAYAYDVEEHDLFAEVTDDLGFALHKIKTEEQLRRLNSIVTSIPQPMCFVSPEYQYLAVNDAYASLYSTPQQDIIGHTPADFLGKHIFETEIRPHLDQALNGLPISYEIESSFPGRGTRWMAMSYFPYRSEMGDIGGVISHGYDITERKRAEEALKAERAQLKSLFDYSGEAIVLLDIENHILEANSGFERIFGYSLEEAQGKIIEDLICPERFYYTESKELDEQALEGIKGVEIIRERKDGEEIDVRVSAGPINIGDNVTGRFAVFDDITERKRTEEALRREEEKFRMLVENTVDWVWQVDASCHYTYVSPQAKTLIGYDADEIYGKTPFDFMSPAEAERTAPIFAKAVERGERVLGLEDTLLAKGGSNVIFETNATPLFGANDDIIGYIGTCRDITGRKHAEEEKEKLQAQLAQAHKMEAIGTMAGGIAHDFNNILSIIVGNTEMAMLDVPEWSPAQNNLKEVREATFRARELVKQILMFARQKEHTVSNIRLEPIARESIKMLRASIPTTVKIHTKIKKSLPPVLADPTQIQQIIMNLCTNAGQVMEAEGGAVTFALDSVELDTQLVAVAGVLPPGQYVRMQVKDTGPGIPPEIMERLFDPFFTTKGVGEGTGLGLAVVHGIVQDRNGGIIVESEEGRGTTFSIYLPASGIESEDLTMGQKKDLHRGTERVLFVDDEPMIMKLGKHMLERQGYVVEARASGTDALECFKQDPSRFDLVVTDMTMPGMRGDRLAEEIMAIRPDVPVILCTGYSKQISNEKAREMGIRAFVMKPFTRHELANTVREALDEKPQR